MFNVQQNCAIIIPIMWRNMLRLLLSKVCKWESIQTPVFSSIKLSIIIPGITFITKPYAA